MTIHLHFLQKALLDDRLFLRDYFAQFKQLKCPAIVLHDHISDDIRRVEMTTKRISAYLSEEMVPSAAFSAYQRNLYQLEPTPTVNATQLTKLCKTLHCIVLNGVVKDAKGNYILADVDTLLLNLTYVLQAVPVFFPTNPMSPLGQKPVSVHENGAYGKLLQAYSEESSILQLAQKVPGAYIACARSFFAIGA